MCYLGAAVGFCLGEAWGEKRDFGRGWASRFEHARRELVATRWEEKPMRCARLVFHPWDLGFRGTLTRLRLRGERSR